MVRPCIIRRATGFSLPELLFVVAVVAVLAAVAYPAYTSHLQRAQRAEARVSLMEAQLHLERQYALLNRYPDALPARLVQVPAAGAPRYLVSLLASAGQYTLTATPQGAMAADRCGALTLSSTGQRGATGSAPAAECWR